MEEDYDYEYYNLIGPLSYMLSVVNRDVIMRRMTVVGFDLGRVNMDAAPSFLSSARVFLRAHRIHPRSTAHIQHSVRLCSLSCLGAFTKLR